MRYGRNGFDFGDFEITKREILASISIIAVMILFGILISSKISEHQMDKNEIYNNKLTQWPFNKIVSLGHDKQDSFVFEQDVHFLGLFEHNWHTPVDVK